MTKFLYFFFTFFILSSCADINDIEFKGIDGVKLEKTENNGLAVKLGVKVNNPKAFSIKIKPSEVDFFIEDQLIGKAFLDETVKIIKKKEDTYFAKVRISLEDGILFKMFRFALKDKLHIRVKGVIKGSALGFPKIYKLDQATEVDGAKLKLKDLLNF